MYFGKVQYQFINKKIIEEVINLVGREEEKTVKKRRHRKYMKRCEREMKMVISLLMADGIF